ncbi:chitin disaccharide deacetylase [Peribacillus deserti]|uniref:Carbohydrate deacetylase n=1 Tax=Peribacillus deserti TaxID=673318 RepID=A0A2N5M3K1_9BACI|nr:chitin disaccharide deacetylase [Peribacillus deserti]PLT28853.1 chitin disaccharide deacetylase [Peribacillus deserti]
MKLIINADDFGYSNGVNLGIIEAFQKGIVTSATLMANMPGAAHAAALAAQNPGLGVGIHLVLDCGYPVNSSVHSLVDDTGKFHKTDVVLSGGDIKDIEKELTSQIERFLSFGLVPTHIDSHHHVHGHERVFPIVKDLAIKYDIPIRPASEELLKAEDSLKSVDYFNPEFYGESLSNQTIIDVINKCKDYETAEIMTHPAYLDEAILSGSSYALPRVRELSILTAQEVRDFISEQGIELATYKQIAGQSYV